MKRILFSLSVAIALTGLPVVAGALDYNADLSLSIAGQYNDNIFLSHTERVGDYSTAITPAVAISTRTEKVDLMLNYSPSFTYYNSHSYLCGNSGKTWQVQPFRWLGAVGFRRPVEAN